jgi:hypothetical protein
VKYVDPSGHKICMDDGYCGKYHEQMSDPLDYWKGLVEERFGVKFSGDWSSKSISVIYFALLNMDNTLFKGALNSLINGAIFFHENKAPGTYRGATWLNGRGITFGFNLTETPPYQNVYHEVAHLIDIRFESYFTDALDRSSVYTKDGDFVMGRRYGIYDRQVGAGYLARKICDPYWGCSIDAEQHPGTIHSFSEWGQIGNTADEEWADLVANYVSGNISKNDYGAARANWLKNILNTFFALPVNAR